MLTTEQTLAMIKTEKAQALLVNMYGQEHLAQQTSRYESLIHAYQKHFGDNEILLFSAPGRCEIGGNHTDHNYGKVLAGSINLDTIAAAAKVEEPVITFISEGYADTYEIDLTDLSPQPGDDGTRSLVRGIAAGCKEFGYEIGGFTAYVSSSVFSASGLSSSASFEMLICTILSSFYNHGSLDAVAMSKIGQYAEHQYWNKPSGLLDQMACAYGGLIAIDFNDPIHPEIRPLECDFQSNGYSLVIVNTGGNHADLTEDYASVPHEMHAVAKLFGVQVCRQISKEQLYASMSAVREQAGDRAVLRALHFFEENERVDGQVKALEEGQFDEFLSLVNESGNSSWKWLQNCYRSQDVKEQDIPIALAITESYIKMIGQGACRVHGGGFAGVILAILPNDKVSNYKEQVEATLGTSVLVIQVREHGAIEFNRFV
ncbi:galactokinase [Paenibacillus lemnae]|uniref:Galactokinase n=1 Tax=Paenibacillus lemnae TaxID=1330551 RepID=A0A848MDR3_PAELE|nr:galactokinase family protein [Paenibacillus lemnae]NMO98223.1 galactokinase [Paenibacillus lemnae]